MLASPKQLLSWAFCAQPFCTANSASTNDQWCCAWNQLGHQKERKRKERSVLPDGSQQGIFPLNSALEYRMPHQNALLIINQLQQPDSMTGTCIVKYKKVNHQLGHNCQTWTQSTNMNLPASSSLKEVPCARTQRLLIPPEKLKKHVIITSDWTATVLELLHIHTWNDIYRKAMHHHKSYIVIKWFCKQNRSFLLLQCPAQSQGTWPYQETLGWHRKRSLQKKALAHCIQPLITQCLLSKGQRRLLYSSSNFTYESSSNMCCLSC